MTEIGPKSMKRTYAYLRTSGKVNPSDSIPLQKKTLEGYANEQGLEINDYFTDEEKTGLNQNREGFQKLKALVERGIVDLVLVTFFDRLGRNDFEMALFLMKLKEANVECVAVEQEKTLSNMTDTEIVQVAINADKENRERTQRIHGSKNKAVEQGEFAFKLPPYGYDKGPDRRLVKNQNAEFVETAFHLLLEYRSFKKVKNRLEEMFPNIDINFQKLDIRRLLSKKTYTGYIYRTTVHEDGTVTNEKLAKVPHEQIISEDIFDQVAEIINRNPIVKKSRKETQLFSKVLYCSRCKQPLYRYNQKYVCKTKGCQGYFLGVTPKAKEFLKTLDGIDYRKLDEEIKQKMDEIKSKQEQLEMDYAALKISKSRLNERLFSLNEEMSHYYEQYKEKDINNAGYTELIEKGDDQKLREVILKQNLKLAVTKTDEGLFEFEVYES